MADRTETPERRLTLERLLQMHPQQFEMEWIAVGRDLGLIGRAFARCRCGLSPEARRWNCFRVLGVGK